MSCTTATTTTGPFSRNVTVPPTYGGIPLNTSSLPVMRICPMCNQNVTDPHDAMCPGLLARRIDYLEAALSRHTHAVEGAKLVRPDGSTTAVCTTHPGVDDMAPHLQAPASLEYYDAWKARLGIPNTPYPTDSRLNIPTDTSSGGPPPKTEEDYVRRLSEAETRISAQVQQLEAASQRLQEANTKLAQDNLALRARVKHLEKDHG